MLRLIPPPVHRMALRVAHRLRSRFRRLAKPALRGVSAIIDDGEGRVLLVRHSYGSGLWALPGGGCGRSEAPEDAVRREIDEELGLALARLRMIETLEETVSGAPHTAYIFTARAAGEPRPDCREVIAAQFFAPDALPEDTGRITRRRLEGYIAPLPERGKDGEACSERS